jgi:hypothetical protein
MVHQGKLGDPEASLVDRGRRLEKSENYASTWIGSRWRQYRQEDTVSPDFNGSVFLQRVVTETIPVRGDIMGFAYSIHRKSSAAW